MTRRTPITQTKISVPRRRTEYLSRKRLIDLLNDFMDTKLAIIAAPAGYGKTSLLIDFARQTGIPVCWYSIDALDQEIIRFLSYFISCINKQFPAFGGDSFSAITDRNDANINIDTLCTTIVNDLYEHVLEHFIIILDDYHLLGSNQKVEQFISRFIHSVDENCHLIIASRALLTLPDLPLLVAQSQVSGLSYEELTFSAEEVQSLFSQNFQLELPPDALDTLMSQTEGWITGIVLATQIYGRESTHLARIKRVTGISLYDYLSEQVLSKQPDQIKKFLLLTSVLEEFDIQLCRETLAGCMGDSNPVWSELVSYTLHNSLFALPVGDDAISIRYHHLFRDFLQNRAVIEYPDECKIIRLRLANHYQKLKDWVHAYQILKQLGDIDSIIEMISKNGSEILASGNLLSLSEWLDDLPEEIISNHPELLSLQGSVRVMRGQVEAGLADLNLAIPRFQDSENRLHLIRALLRRSDTYRLLGRYTLAIQDANQALSIAKKLKSMIASQAEALRALGVSFYNTGAFIKSKTHLQKSLLMYQETNDTHNIALVSMEMGLVLTNMNKYDQAEEIYKKALALWSKSGNSVWQANITNNLGVLYHQTGDFITAISSLERAYSHAKQGGYPRMEAYCLSSIGDIYRDLGASTEAEEAYQKAISINENVKDRFLTIYLGLAKAESALQKHDLKNAEIAVQQALELANQGSSESEIALARTWQGRFFIFLNKPRLAIEPLLLSVETFDRERDRANGVPARFYLAVARYLTGDVKTTAHDLHLVKQSLQIINGWSNIIIPAQRMKSQLISMVSLDELRPIAHYILSLVNDFEERLPALRRQVRQHSLTVPFGPPRLSIRGLGSMQVKLNTKTVTTAMWQTVLSRDLFFYLLQHSGGATKEAVGLAFWPEAEPDDVKLRFKNAIYRLRRAVGKEVILFQDDCYSFNRSLDYEYDVDVFINELTLAQVEQHKPEKLTHIKNAIHTYKGHLLPGLDHFEIIVERERLQHLFENACIEASELSLALGNHQDSINLCLRAIEMDPYLETAYQVLFKAYAAIGNKAAIVKSFGQLEQILKKDLSTTPSRETIKVYKGLI